MPTTTTPQLTPLKAYLQAKELRARIAQLVKEEKQLSELYKSSFRTNALSLSCEDGFRLVRTEHTRKPYTVPGGTYYRYDLIKG